MEGMGRIITVLLLALAAMALAAGAQAQLTSAASSVTGSAESISPYPVEPGQDFTLQLRLYNEGGTIAEAVSVEYAESAVFTLTGKEDSFDRSFSLCSKCTRDNLYYFTVSPDASSGEYPLIFKVNDGEVTRQTTVMVRVVGKPDVIFEAEVLDEAVMPDSSFVARLTVRNVGTGVARKLKLTPETAGFVMEGANLLFIDKLGPGESSVHDVTFLVSGDALPGPQSLALGMDYADEQSTQYSTEQSFGVKLLNSVRLNIASVAVDRQPIQKGERAVVTVRVENVGEGTAENIQVALRNSGFEGQSKAYIGRLEEGEDAPTVFTIVPGEAGTHEFRILVTYEDDEGSHEIAEEIDLLVVGKDMTRTLIIVGAALAVAYFAYAYFLKGKE